MPTHHLGLPNMEHDQLFYCKGNQLPPRFFFGDKLEDIGVKVRSSIPPVKDN